jgi:hypothetical protein
MHLTDLTQRRRSYAEKRQRRESLLLSRLSLHNLCVSALNLPLADILSKDSLGPILSGTNGS